MWIDIASIVFVCVTANHLGLIEKLTEVFRVPLRKLPIIGCVKCLTFWTSVVYGFAEFKVTEQFTFSKFITVLAISFLCSYLAIWLELLEGYVDTLYEKLYDKIYSAEG